MVITQRNKPSRHTAWTSVYIDAAVGGGPWSAYALFHVLFTASSSLYHYYYIVVREYPIICLD